MKILFVGQAPSRDTDGQPPFTGRSGRKLAKLCGISHAEFLNAFELVNLLERWPGKSGKGDAFPMAEARLVAASLDFRNRPLVVLVGRNVARAFDAADVAYFKAFLLGRVSAVGINTHDFSSAWRLPDQPAQTVLQGGALMSNIDRGGAGYVEIKYVPAVVIPHPSGLNRWWNSPANTEKARQFMLTLKCSVNTSRQQISV